MEETELQNPAYENNDRYTDNGWFLENSRGCIHPSKTCYFDKHVLLITKQLRGETVEHFYGKIKELAENCDSGNKEETLIRDVSITN